MAILRYIEHTCIHGEAYDALALRYYNEETMADRIINANPEYGAVVTFEGGEKIKIPVLDLNELPESLPPWRRT